MSNLYIQEAFVNKTRGERYGETPVYETFTDDTGPLYRSLQSEYGRCTGRIYIDREGDEPQKVGWVFEKRVQYDDSHESYLREVWVTVHEKPDTVIRERHYVELAA